MTKFSLLCCIFLTSHFILAQKAEMPDSNNRGKMTVKADYRVAELQERYRAENEGQMIDGYRIQLYSGNRTGAFEKKQEVIRTFNDLPCNVIYEAPDFKVQVGDFRTQLEAEKAMQEIWPVFKSAFVVAAKINMPQLGIEKETKSVEKTTERVDE